MRDKLVKCKKKKINWREVIFQLHNFEISRSYDLFHVSHPNMSINRCAYNVLKTYYSTTTLRFIRNYFRNSTLSEKEVVEWFLFYKRIGVNYEFC